MERGFRLEKSVKDDLLEEDPRFQIFLDQTAVSQKIVLSPKANIYTFLECYCCKGLIWDIWGPFGILTIGILILLHIRFVALIFTSILC